MENNILDFGAVADGRRHGEFDAETPVQVDDQCGGYIRPGRIECKLRELNKRIENFVQLL